MSSPSPSPAKAIPRKPGEPVDQTEGALARLTQLVTQVVDQLTDIKQRLDSHDETFAILYQENENRKREEELILNEEEPDKEEGSDNSDEGFKLFGADEPEDPKESASSSSSSALSRNETKRLRQQQFQHNLIQQALDKKAKESGTKVKVPNNSPLPSESTKSSVEATPAPAKTKIPTTALSNLLKSQDPFKPTEANDKSGSDELSDLKKAYAEHRKQNYGSTLKTHTKFDGKELSTDYNVHDLIAKRTEMRIFEARNQCQIRWDDVLDATVKTRIMRKYGHRQEIKYFGVIDDDKVWKFLLAAIEPVNEYQFSSVLLKYHPTPEYLKFRVSASNFDNVWMDLTIEHIEGFTEVLEALMECNSDYCPNVWTPSKIPGQSGVDKKSLTAIFLDTFPNDFGKGIHKLLPADFKRGSFADYISKIRDQLDIEAEICRQSDAQRRFIKESYNSRHGKDDRLAAIDFDGTRSTVTQIMTRSDPFDDELHALVTAKSSESKLPQGCFKVIEKGYNGCTDGHRCKYSHKSEDLDRTWEWMVTHHKKKLELLNQRLYRPNNPNKFVSKPGHKLAALNNFDEQRPIKTPVHLEPSDSDIEDTDSSNDVNNA